MAALDSGRHTVRLVGEGDSPTSLATYTPGFLPGSSIQETDLDAFEGSDTPPPSKRSAPPHRSATLRGAALAPANAPGRSHPSTGGVYDLHLLPVPRGTFSMRGELMHTFVSYRVNTEGMVLTLQQCEDLCPATLASLESPCCTSRTPDTP